jgi:2-polyprenyl-3-methyl-5-hydroxy-6-metoxy-1,4-benzoquinol methylase
MKQWYESLFENYGLTYDKEPFTQGAAGECDFIEKEMDFRKSARILDVGCGTGRHSIELAKRGYSVTGVDLSDSQLNRAKQKAIEQNVHIDFRKADARYLSFNQEYDLAIMLCEGAFPLMETDEMNFAILKNTYNALREHGKLIFTTLNGLFPLFHSVKEFIASQTQDGNATCNENSFDLMTFRDHSTTTIQDDLGNRKELQCNERYYVPSEIAWLLRSINFKTAAIYGAKLGAFSRNDTLTTEDFEMLVIAEK